MKKKEKTPGEILAEMLTGKKPHTEKEFGESVVKYFKDRGVNCKIITPIK